LMKWAKQHESTDGTLELDWDSLHGRFVPDKIPEESTIMNGAVSRMNTPTG